ncbi:hypothetical protein ACWDX6_15120 [Streptomyces sp. NPDC003027]
MLALLVALFGICGGTAGGGGTEAGHAASAVPDPGGEAHDTAESEAASPGRARSRRRAAARRGRPPAPPAPVRRASAAASVIHPAPRDRALRCVVMRC